VINMELQLAKGMKDSLPQDQIQKQKLMDFLKKIFELYGYSPLDTPAIERFDVLSSKYAGGAEILKETFKLKDQGNRDLGLRYDLTVPFARVVGMNPELKMPFKRYQMAKVWRDGPIGMGRYREFWQCDVDLVGSRKMSAEGELMAMVDAVFREFNLKYKIELNNRKLLGNILDYLGVQKNQMDILLIIDKIKKISKSQLEKELKTAGMDKKQIIKLQELFEIKGNSQQKLEKIEQLIGLKPGISELKSLFEYLDAYNITDYELELSLTRGLAFYTGTVFETYLVNNEIKSAVASGGRYDNIIGQFINSKLEYPCVGISFGLSRIADAIKEKNEIKTVTKVFVIPIGVEKEAIPIVQKLRQNGINAEIDLNKKGISKNLNYANSLNIPYTVFIGENELKQNKFKLRDMASGKETLLTLDKLIKKLKE
jgi:histidyl-tRNA synthetase